MRFYSCTTAGLLSLTILLASCGSEAVERPTPPPPIVTAANPINELFSPYEEYTGRLEAVATVELRSRITGFLEEQRFADGDSVQEGDVLFVIDKDTIEAVVRQRTANLERAKAAELLAKTTFERNEQLAAQQAISRQELDVAAAQFAEAQAAVKAAEADLEAANLELSFAEIKAPISGRVSSANVSTGNLVVANSTVLATIVGMEPIYASFSIDEAALLRYRSAQPAPDAEEGDRSLRSRNVVARLAIGTDPDFRHTGTLDYSDPFVDPNTGTIRVRAIFQNERKELLPGLFVRVRVSSSEPRQVVRIPVRALGTDQDRRFAYVIGSDGTIQYRQLRLGLESGGLVVVEEGINPDDNVVIDGILKVRPGVKPEVQKADLSQFLPANAAEKAQAE